MSATSGFYNPAGQGWRLAYSLVTLAHELAAVYGDQLTCLGTVGDLAHQAEGYSSDHEPFIRDPNAPSVGIVRAIDFGGSDALLKQIRQHIWALYAAKDARVYLYGYSKGCSDNLINNWGLPFGTHVDTGDAGHLHISVTQVNGNHPSPSGYVAAIDSTAPWGFAGNSPSGGGTPIGDDMELTDLVPVWGSATAQQTVSFALAKAAAAYDAVGSESTVLTQIASVLTGLQQPDVDETKLAADLAASLNAALPGSVVAALAAKLGATS